jgi:hypothetical protein
MRIEKNSTEINRAAGVRPAASPAAGTPGHPAAPASAVREDGVEVSPEARALAARLREAAPGEETSPEEIAELRRRVAAGVYHSPEMAERIAERLLDSDDL